MIERARTGGIGILRLFAWSQLVATAMAIAIAPGARAHDGTSTFVMRKSAKPLTAIGFLDEHGQAQSLERFRGKVIVLNIWATWCVPCRTEMPTLDRLQAERGGEDFEVVAVSIDRDGLNAVSKFFSEIGVKHLAKYTDSSGKMLRSVRAIGLPTTLIVDRSGNEAGRVIGPAEWDSPEVIELLKSVIAKPSAPIESANRTTEAAQRNRQYPLSRGFQWLKEWVQ